MEFTIFIFSNKVDYDAQVVEARPEKLKTKHGEFEVIYRKEGSYWYCYDTRTGLRYNHLGTFKTKEECAKNAETRANDREDFVAMRSRIPTPTERLARDNRWTKDPKGRKLEALDLMVYSIL